MYYFKKFLLRLIAGALQDGNIFFPKGVIPRKDKNKQDYINDRKKTQGFDMLSGGTHTLNP